MIARDPFRSLLALVVALCLASCRPNPERLAQDHLGSGAACRERLTVTTALIGGDGREVVCIKDGAHFVCLVEVGTGAVSCARRRPLL